MPVLIYVLEHTLRLLHPYMPFITEEIWLNMKERVPGINAGIPSIMVAPYPEANMKFIDPEAERIVESLIEIVRSIRNVRAEYKVDIAKFIPATIYSNEMTGALKDKAQVIEVLSKARPLSILNREERQPDDAKSISVVLKESEVVIPLAGIVDIEAEKKRLNQEAAEVTRDIDRLEARMADESFLGKAPAAIVAKEKERLQSQKDRLERLKKEIALFS